MLYCEQLMIEGHIVNEFSMGGHLAGQETVQYIKGVLEGLQKELGVEFIRNARMVLLGAIGLIAVSTLMIMVGMLITLARMKKRIREMEENLQNCKEKKSNNCEIIEMKLKALYAKADKETILAKTKLDKINDIVRKNKKKKELS